MKLSLSLIIACVACAPDASTDAASTDAPDASTDATDASTDAPDAPDAPDASTDATDAPDASTDACTPIPEVDPSGDLTFSLVSGDCPSTLTYSDLTDRCEASTDPHTTPCLFEQLHTRCVFGELKFDATQRVDSEGWHWIVAAEHGTCIYVRGPRESDSVP